MGDDNCARAQVRSAGYQDAGRNSNEFSILGLTRDAVALYKYAVANPGWSADDVCADIGLDRDGYSAAISVLHANRLIRKSVDPDRLWDTVTPKCALADLVMCEEAKLRQAQVSLLRAQEELLSLVPSYFDALQQRARTEAVDVFHGNLTADRLFIEQGRKLATEVCVTSSGSGPDGIGWMRELSNEIAGLRRRVNMRFVLDHSAQAQPVIRRHMRTLERSGWGVRTGHFVPFELVLVDHDAAFLPVRDGSRGYDVTVVRHPAVVASYRAAFERLWSMSSPLVAHGRLGLDIFRDQLRVEILHLLAGGKKDEVIARQLGLSVRTCRRHIAAIMEALGATGRFQAGVMAQRLIFDGDEPGLTPSARSS